MLFCCDCEPVPVTMTRVGIWPASPQFPQMAFTFGLLDWVEALTLECQVALKDLCAALYFKCPYIIKKVRLHSELTFVIILIYLLLVTSFLVEKRYLPFHDRCYGGIPVRRLTKLYLVQKLDTCTDCILQFHEA